MQMASSQQQLPRLTQSNIHQQPVATIPVQPRPPPGNPNLVMPPNPIPVIQVPVPRQQVPITTHGGTSMLQPVQTHPNLVVSSGLVPQSTVLQQNLRPPFGHSNLTHQPAPHVPSISMPQKRLVQPASQVHSVRFISGCNPGLPHYPEIDLACGNLAKLSAEWWESLMLIDSVCMCVCFSLFF
jgi:hypothetical protein